MKVVEIIGSPRTNGPSTRISKSFTDHASESGAEVKSYRLNKMQFKGCQSCLACKGKIEECSVHDSLTEVLNAMRDSDVAILSTPVYFWDVAGQYKLFFDRTFSFAKPDFYTNPKPGRLDPGKTAILILTQGAGDDVHQDVPEKYKKFLQYGGYDRVEVIRATSQGMTTDSDAEKYITRARELAQELVN